MTTGLYKQQGAYSKIVEHANLLARIETENRVRAEIAKNTADGRSYGLKPFYLPLPNDKEKPHQAFFEWGCLVTVAKEEAEVGELVAVDDMPPSVSDTIELLVGAPQTMAFPGMEHLSEYAPQFEIRVFRMRYWGPQFLGIKAWERV